MVISFFKLVFCLIHNSFSLLRSFDPTNSGRITENRFVKIMKSKENVAEEDISEMIAGPLMLRGGSFKDHKLYRISEFACKMQG